MTRHPAHGGVHEFEATAGEVTFKVDFGEDGKGYLVSAFDQNGVPYIPTVEEAEAFVTTAEQYKAQAEQ